MKLPLFCVNKNMIFGKVFFEAVDLRSDVRKLRSLLQSFPSLVRTLDKTGRTALERAAGKANVATVRELLKFNAEITLETWKSAKGNMEIENELKIAEEGRRQSKRTLSRSIKTHINEPELTWTGSGFKVKDNSWIGWVRINRHRNYIASPALGKVNEMCRRGC